jgi:hypothetical protein
MIIDVQIDDGTVCLAYIVAEDASNDTFDVRFLSHNKDLDIYNFDENIETIPKESVVGFYDTSDLEDTGMYKMTENGYEMIEDSDYEPETESDDDTDDDISLDEEDDL